MPASKSGCRQLTWPTPARAAARATASSPSGCAMHCMAIGATSNGNANRRPASQTKSTVLGPADKCSLAGSHEAR